MMTDTETAANDDRKQADDNNNDRKQTGPGNRPVRPNRSAIQSSMSETVRLASKQRRSETTVQLRKSKRMDLIGKQRTKLPKLPSSVSTDLPVLSTTGLPDAAETGRRLIKTWMTDLKTSKSIDEQQSILALTADWLDLPTIGESDYQAAIDAGVVYSVAYSLHTSTETMANLRSIRNAVSALASIAWSITAHAAAVFVDSTVAAATIRKTLKRSSDILTTTKQPVDRTELLEDIRTCCCSCLTAAAYEGGQHAKNAFADDGVLLVSSLCKPTSWTTTRVEAIRSIALACRSAVVDMQAAIPAINGMLFDDEEEDSMVHACAAVSYLYQQQKPFVDAVDDSKRSANNPNQASVAAGRLSVLLLHESAAVRNAAVQALSSMLCGTDADAQIALNAGCLSGILSALDIEPNETDGCTAPRSVRKHAMAAVASICAGTAGQIDLLIQTGGIEIVTDALRNDPSADVQIEGLRSLRNLARYATIDQIGDIVAVGIIDSAVDLLRVDNQTDVLSMAIDALIDLLKRDTTSADDDTDQPIKRKIEEAGAVDILVAVVGSPNDVVSRSASRLLACFDEP